jgi:uncharacterized protein YbjT (DUF2867 family)
VSGPVLVVGATGGLGTAFAPAASRWTSLLVADVARFLVLAVDEPRAVGRRIDLGMDRPFSA